MEQTNEESLNRKLAESTWYRTTNLAVTLLEQERLNEALVLFEQAVKIAEEAFGAEHPKVARSLRFVGQLNLELGRYTEAIALTKRILAIYEKCFGPDHLSVVGCQFLLATVYLLQGCDDKFQAAHTAALGYLDRIIDSLDATDSEELADLLTFTELHYHQVGRDAEARELETRIQLLRLRGDQP
jgi:tetratricopeptide (TPR) repeat protein